MESLTRLVTESLARHGFDRPLDYRRLRWSRWFRCESHHSLLLVPSKPGVFALAEEIVDFGSGESHVTAAAGTGHLGTAAAVGTSHVGTAALGCPPERSSSSVILSDSVEERRFSAVSIAGTSSAGRRTAASAAERETADGPRRMLAVTEFFEADDMAFVLDRMLARQNPMRDRLNSGRYFIRFVVIEDGSHRRSVCTALNQWLSNSTDIAGIASHFASSLELTSATEYVPASAQGSLFETTGAGRPFPSAGQAVSANAGPDKNPNHTGEANPSASISATSIAARHLDSGAATNIHCPSPLPSGF
jgi:hypothetical protein